MTRLRLVKTCGACPEQYDVFDGDVQVGYMRLRHGHFRVDVPDCGGKTIYTATPDGDGSFQDEERIHYLNAGCRAILSGGAFDTEPIYDEEDGRGE